MKPLILFFLILAWLIALSQRSYAQCGPPPASNCQPFPASALMMSGSSNIDFTFDNFQKYINGITFGGATTLRLTVNANNASCKWKLRVYIDNNPLAPTPNNEWEALNSFGSSGDAPALDLLEVKFYNGCNTPVNSGIYQHFAAVNGSYIDIINDIVLVPAGSCITNTNGVGSYLTNYKEYTFNIDYRIKPGVQFKAGAYQISLRFCLVEDV